MSPRSPLLSKHKATPRLSAAAVAASSRCNTKRALVSETRCALSPHAVCQCLHVPCAPPQLSDHICVTDHHQRARDRKQHHELVDREHAALLGLVTVVESDTGHIVVVHQLEGLLRDRR